LLEAINEYRTMFIKPPNEEQLERANLKGRIIATVLVEQDEYPSFVLGCVELLPKSENNEEKTQSSSNYSTSTMTIRYFSRCIFFLRYLGSWFFLVACRHFRNNSLLVRFNEKFKYVPKPIERLCNYYF
jgi:hypothetical protein